MKNVKIFAKSRGKSAEITNFHEKEQIFFSKNKDKINYVFILILLSVSNCWQNRIIKFQKQREKRSE